MPLGRNGRDYGPFSGINSLYLCKFSLNPHDSKSKPQLNSNFLWCSMIKMVFWLIWKGLWPIPKNELAINWEWLTDCETLRLLDCQTVIIRLCGTEIHLLCETMRIWHTEVVRLWDCETMRLTDCESVRLWDFETEKLNYETVRLWDSVTKRLSLK